jgi:hypothetical protein
MQFARFFHPITLAMCSSHCFCTEQASDQFICMPSLHPKPAGLDGQHLGGNVRESRKHEAGGRRQGTNRRRPAEIKVALARIRGGW